MTKTLDTILQDGWREHASDRPATLQSLEQHEALATTGAEAARVLGLATHVAGEESALWPRAAALADRFVARLPQDAALVPVLAQAAAAHALAGEPARALGAEARALALDPEHAASTAVLVRAAAVGSLAASDRLDAAAVLLSATLDLVTAALPAGGPHDRALAVAANNVASALLERTPRSAEQDVILQRAADAARASWLRAGDWRNDERADYLLTLVANALGQPEVARLHGERALGTIARCGEENVDAAFLHVALAIAAHAVGDGAAHRLHLGAAEDLAASFADDVGLTEWFRRELAKARWA